MERKDLLQINKKIFMEQAKALAAAKPDVRCVVVANPANTNALMPKEHAPSIPAENMTALTRLDHNRALAQVGLEGFDGRLSHHLSVGQKKRAAIATVLAMDPDVLVLAASLDRELDSRGYIRPGLGDAGDRIFGTQ